MKNRLTHQVSYEAGVIAARIHPKSKGNEMIQNASFDAVESLHHLVTNINHFNEDDFIEGFATELCSLHASFFNEMYVSDTYKEMQGHGKEILKDILED